MDLEILKSILIAAVLGFMIGMQRAIYHLSHDEKSFAGSRTFSIIAIVGYMAGFINKHLNGIAIVAGITIGLIVLLAYYFKISTITCKDDDLDFGSTTHFAAIATYFLGLMISLNLEKYAIVLAILIVALLEIKPKLRRFEAKITSTDINAAVLLLAMTFIVLPILPNKFIDPYGLFNPYKTWLMAVLISTISFIGYAAIKIFGHKKGLFLTGALGGLISSTAVSVSMSKLALAQKRVIEHASGAIAVACTFMFLRVLILVFVINKDLVFKLSIPFAAATVAGLLYSYLLFKRTKPLHLEVEDSFAKNPLQLSEAVKFGIFFGIIYGATSFLQSTYGNLGIYLVSFFSGLTDVDAITLSLAELAKNGRLSEMTSINGIILASVVNSFVKLGIGWWIGGTNLGIRLLKYFAITLGSLGIGIILIR